MSKKITIFANTDKERQGKREDWRSNGHNLALFPHPSKVCFIGRPGMGKTNLMKNLLVQTQISKKPFQKMYVICPSVNHEWKDADPTEIYNNILEFKPDMIDSKKKTLLVLDDIDLGSPNKAEKKQLSEIFRYVSSHMGVSVWVSYQSFFDVPSIIRKCCSTFVLWRPVSSQELTTIANRVGMKKEIMKTVFDEICTDPYDSLCVDLSIGTPAKYRKNIYDVIQIDDD